MIIMMAAMNAITMKKKTKHYAFTEGREIHTNSRINTLHLYMRRQTLAHWPFACTTDCVRELKFIVH